MERIDFLPLVKAYPALSKTYGEVSCIAGVRMSGEGAPEWIRLYPVPFRALDSGQQFSKYQPITVEVERHSGDRRPETRRPNRDSIEISGNAVSSDNGWQRRKRFVAPLMADSMCEILRRQKEDGTSLGIFRPKRVLDIVIEPADVSAEKQAIANAWAAQPSLLDEIVPDEQKAQIKALQLMPWTFKYRYECSDPACKTHTQSIIDWEISGTYRHVKNRPDWQERVKARWLGDLCAEDRDTAFIVGNMHQHPASFLVLGVWWPQRQAEQLSLAELSNI